MKPLSPACRARELVRRWLKGSRESARAEADRLVQEHENRRVTMMKTRYCGNCGGSTNEEEQKYCTECGTELPEQGQGQEPRPIRKEILIRAVIAAAFPIPVFLLEGAITAESGTSICFRAAQCIETPYAAGVYAVAFLIAAWELMFWVVRASQRAAAAKIPFVLIILTGWWAYGIVTLIFNDMEDPYTGETSGRNGGVLSALPWVPLQGTIREVNTEWEAASEPAGKPIAVGLTIYLPMLLSAIIIFLTVPLG